MDNISKSQQEAIFRTFATPTTSFSDQFNDQYSQSLSKYKRNRPTSHSSHSSPSSESDSSSDSSSSTGDEAPEYIPNGQGNFWKSEVGSELQRALEVAILLNQKDEEAQLHREIGVFRNFIAIGYFECMELYPETTVDLIRDEITKAANESSQLDCLGDINSFSPPRPSSALSTNLASVLGSSPPRILKALPKSKRIAKAVAAVREGSSMREAADLYGVNRQTVANRLSGKYASIRREDRMLLTTGEEAALLRFVDQYVALGFPPRLAMLREKAILLLRERGVDESPGINWPTRFLRRYPQYDSKFPRHLDQERHFNSELSVVINWFELYDRTCLKYSIATGDQTWTRKVI